MSARCSKCGHRFKNPKADFECAAWCAYAEECLGFAPPRDETANLGGGGLASRLLQTVKQQCESDPGRVTHAMVVFQHAKQLISKEGGDPRIVFAAALLLEIELLSTIGQPTTADQPSGDTWDSARARKTLKEIDFDAETIERVCRTVVSYLGGDAPETVESRIVSDAHRLADLGVKNLNLNSMGLDKDVLDGLKTEAARARAKSLFS
ncbi:MAG TPA: hypothetical protein VE890_10660 [Thermoguttaceae bacterium]|nr:hypothetical protein [Thermoguttaceae bacterium]